MKVTDFDYDLPKELIAQTPIEKRDESKLMVLDRSNETQRYSRILKTRRCVS